MPMPVGDTSRSTQKNAAAAAMPINAWTNRPVPPGTNGAAAPSSARAPGQAGSVTTLGNRDVRASKNASGTPAAARAQNAGACGLSPNRTATATTVVIVTNVAVM